MKAKLVDIKDEKPGTKTFLFEPEEKIDYQAGQYVYFTVPKLTREDGRGDTRHFTLSSSPRDKYISFTTRFPDPMSGYKQTLLQIKPGTEFEIRGPQGHFVIEKPLSTKKHIFLAGGIGITPFRSMIKDNVDNNLKIPMYLIYSNSNNNFVFGEELEKYQKENENIKVEFFDSSKKGHLNKEAINETTNRWGLESKSCIFWIVGPPPFVDALESEVEKLGIDSDNIKTEKFTGY